MARPQGLGVPRDPQHEVDGADVHITDDMVPDVMEATFRCDQL
jgi:hypothetical protein